MNILTLKNTYFLAHLFTILGFVGLVALFIAFPFLPSPHPTWWGIGLFLFAPQPIIGVFFFVTYYRMKSDDQKRKNATP